MNTYNELPLLPPPVDLETKAILKATTAAHVALAELRGAAKSIPDDGILVRAIALQEARVSSEIEMIITTSDELFRALSKDEESADPATKEVLLLWGCRVAWHRAHTQRTIGGCRPLRDPGVDDLAKADIGESNPRNSDRRREESKDCVHASGRRRSASRTA